MSMFSKSSLGIQRGADDKLTTHIEGTPSEILTLLATLNAKVLAELMKTPQEYLIFNTKLQENTFKAYLALMEEDGGNQ